ncbi:MAG: aldehyde dehydrogenase (NADP(+)), partial [Chitinophagaceae bacterium]
ANPERTPMPKPDIRKMMIPLGPVVVFGASNFPFAYSTAGGDTASALAAGCPVIVKAHPAHIRTSILVHEAIKRAIKNSELPEAVFQHVEGGFEIGKALVQDPNTAAVGFTGSYSGGMALVEYGRDRKNPIPIFSEMGSVNPVIFLEGALAKDPATLSKSYAGSITLSMGQFCTNPGLMLAVESPALSAFVELLETELKQVKPARMLHPGILTAYNKRRKTATEQSGVAIAELEIKADAEEALPTLAFVKGAEFLKNPVLHEEVFGPYSLLVKCTDATQLEEVFQSVKGQLTTTIMATDEDLAANIKLIDTAKEIAGRVIFNGVPTGVEVCASMVHGGPSPATTDSRFTAVGIQSVRRWVRPVSFQSCPDAFLPDELKNGNPLGLLRFVNEEWTREKLS